MARPIRIEYPGEVYHVTARGNARMAVFVDDADRMGFLEILDDLLPRDALPGKRERDELIRRAHREYGYSYSEIGRHVGFHYATVSRLVKG